MTATETPKQTPLMVRGLDMDIWRRVRAEGVKRGLTAGALLTEILRDWLDRQPAQPI